MSKDTDIKANPPSRAAAGSVPCKYMHTLGGMPAHYYPGEQICLAVRTRPIPLCDTLDQIKREQRMSCKWRLANGFEANRDYGWMKVQSPNAPHEPRGAKTKN